MGRQEPWADLDSCHRFHPPDEHYVPEPDPDLGYEQQAEQHMEQMMEERMERGL